MGIAHRVVFLCLLLASVSGARAQGSGAMAKQLIDGRWEVPHTLTARTSPPAAPQAAAPSSFSQVPFNEAEISLGSWGRAVMARPVTTEFQSRVKTSLDIYYAAPNGKNLRYQSLVSSEWEETEPRLSPDLRSLIYISNAPRAGQASGLFTIYRLDISALPALPHAPMALSPLALSAVSPIWSPDGAHIAFAANSGGNWDIYTMRADGGNVARVTSDPSIDLMPSWHPDGSHLLWVRMNGERGTIWSAKSDGAVSSALGTAHRYLRSPFYRPDGSAITFDYDANGDGWNDLAISDAAGEGERVLTYGLGGGNPHEYAVRGWSYSGDWIVAEYQIFFLQGDRYYFDGSGGQGFDPDNLWEGGLYGSPGIDGDIGTADRSPPVSWIGLPSFQRGSSAAVSWEGRDVGVAESVRFDAQVRAPGSVDWTRVHTRGLATSLTIDGQPGQTFDVRVRGIDAAGNREPWRSQTTVTLFSYQLRGTATDSRSIPLAGATVNGNHLDGALVSGPGGAYTAHFATDALTTTAVGGASIQLARPGFGVPDPLVFAEQDAWATTALPPQASAIGNGSFEADIPLAGWRADGTLPVTTAAADRGGARAARLGAPACADTCLALTSSFTMSEEAIIEDTVYGTDGTIHTIGYRSGDPVLGAARPPQQLVYRQYAADGQLLRDETIVLDAGESKILVTPDGAVHVVAINNNTYIRTVFYLHRAPGGGWSLPEAFENSNSILAFVSDPDGYVYLCTAVPQDLTPIPINRFRIHSPDGTWSAPTRVDAAGMTDVVVTPRQTVAFARLQTVYGENGAISYAKIITEIDRRGLVVSARVYTRDVDGVNDQIVIDPAGRITIVADRSDHSKLQIIRERPDGSFTTPVLTDKPGSKECSLNDAIWSGGLSLLFAGAPSQNGLCDTYRIVKLTTRDATEIIGSFNRTISSPANPSGINYRALRLDTSGGRLRTLLAGRSFFFRINGIVGLSGHSAIEGSATLQQTVLVPAAMHAPTLSFDSTLDGAAPGSVRSGVRIDDGLASTEVLSDELTHGWEHSWIDLGRWSGRTITITWSLEQPGAALPGALTIDNVSVGAWLTPVVRQTQAAQRGGRTILTIGGENFIGEPQVLIDDRPAQLDAVSQTELTVSLGALAPGWHRVSIVNPGGATFLAEPVLVGYQVTLPSISSQR